MPSPIQHPEFGDGIRCSLIAEVVRRFGQVQLRVTGTSMLPAVWPGDMVTVQKRKSPELHIGDIALFTREGRLFAHRVIGRRGALLITRGDALPADDFPVREQELLGVVTAIERGRKRLQPPVRPSPHKRLLTKLLISSAILRRLVPQLVTAWNA